MVLLITVGCLLVGMLVGGGFLGYWLLVVRPQQSLPDNSEQLVGRWSECHSEDPRREVYYEFRKDGGFVLTGNEPGVAKVSVRGTWKVLSSKGNALHLLMTTKERNVMDDQGNLVPRRTEEKPEDYEQDIELLSKDRSVSPRQKAECLKLPPSLRYQDQRACLIAASPSSG